MNELKCSFIKWVNKMANLYKTVHYIILPLESVSLYCSSRIKAREGVEGLKMPYFDFSICYRAGRDEPNAKNGRLI